MKVTKTFSLELEDVKDFEAWMNKRKFKNESQAFRALIKLGNDKYIIEATKCYEASKEAK